jgi:glycerol-3-phosphate cytidylyltransferase
VDEVIPEKDWSQKVDDVKKYNIDIFAIGDDWKGKFDFLKEYCEVVYLHRTKNISTTQLKNILNEFEEYKYDILEAFKLLEQIKKNYND